MIHSPYSSMSYADPQGTYTSDLGASSAEQTQRWSSSGSLLNTRSTIVNPPAQMINARSCLACRRRKVRCTRQQPCMNCDMAGKQCVFSETTKKTRQRKPTAREEVQSRLARLERMVQAILEMRQDANKPENAARATDVARAATDVEIQASDPSETTIDEYSSQHLSFRLDEPYSNESASNRIQLDQVSPQPSGDGLLPFSRSSSQIDGWAFKGRSLVVQLSESAYPLLDWSPILWDVYVDHVAPLFPLLHKATTRSMILRGVQYSTSTAPEDKALTLAIYFVAVVSMSPMQCDMALGESRDNAVWYLKNAVKQALSDARFLSTSSLTCMQAMVLFLIGMYAQNEQRFVRSMTALVVRLVQGMNLNRDGAYLGLAPFDTEMRRRLWWTICLLDVRSCEDHRTDPIINEEMYDVRLPLNVSDDDLYPGMQEPPLERTGGTEMTFSLLRFKTIAIVRQVNSTTVSSIENKEGSAEDYLSKVNKAFQHLNEMYLKHCDLNIPIHWVGAVVTRLILAKASLVAYHRAVPSDNRSSRPPFLREKLINLAFEVLQSDYQLSEHPIMLQWGWHLNSYTQWHAMAVALLEQCLHPMVSVSTGYA